MGRAEKVLVLVVIGAIVTFAAIYLGGGQKQVSTDVGGSPPLSAQQPAPPDTREPVAPLMPGADDPVTIAPGPSDGRAPAPGSSPAPSPTPEPARVEPEPWKNAPASVSLAVQLLPSPFPGTKRYRVQSGDTYEKIALRFWKSTKLVADLERLNPDVDPRRLGTGMDLVVPDLPIVEGSAAKAKPAAAEAPAGPGETYTVEAGDTLIAIARRKYGDQRLWKLIHDANRALLPDASTILRKGMKLRLPPAPAKK